jgi:hypothetical protein
MRKRLFITLLLCVAISTATFAQTSQGAFTNGDNLLNVGF